MVTDSKEACDVLQIFVQYDLLVSRRASAMDILITFGILFTMRTLLIPVG